MIVYSSWRLIFVPCSLLLLVLCKVISRFRVGINDFILLVLGTPPPLHHHIRCHPLISLVGPVQDGEYKHSQSRVGTFLLAVWLYWCAIAYELFNNRGVASPLKH